MGYEILKSIVLPVLSLKEEGQIAHVRIDEQIHLGSALDGENDKPEAERKQPAFICHVTDLDVADSIQSMKQFIVAHTLRKALEDAFPNQTYVDRCFQIENTGKKKGGRAASGYNTFKLFEIGLSTDHWHHPDNVINRANEAKIIKAAADVASVEKATEIKARKVA
jgi:hypothetical protein